MWWVVGVVGGVMTMRLCVPSHCFLPLWLHLLAALPFPNCPVCHVPHPSPGV